MSQEKSSISKLNKQKDCKISLLDLPDVTLDCILEKLSPLDLCRVGQVCTHLRNTSRSDYLWEKHLQQKWSRLLSEDAHSEWEWHRTNIIKPENISSQYDLSASNGIIRGVSLQYDLCASYGTISGVWPYRSLHSYLERYEALTNLIKNCSKMALFICLETGRFWFPAQIFKSIPLLVFQCYDSLASYDSRTDTFRARYNPVHSNNRFEFREWLVVEDSVPWDRLRAPPPKTFLNRYYNSDSLSDLKPGDHIEIQTRTQKDVVPYDRRFAVIAHLESCDKEMNRCRCQYSDKLVVEVKKLVYESQVRRLMLNRNRNVGKELSDGFYLYGGIRKLDQEEIEKWNNIIQDV